MTERYWLCRFAMYLGHDQAKCVAVARQFRTKPGTHDICGWVDVTPVVP